jgi:hypothetical protein
VRAALPDRPPEVADPEAKHRPRSVIGAVGDPWIKRFQIDSRRASLHQSDTVVEGFAIGSIAVNEGKQPTMGLESDKI